MKLNLGENIRRYRKRIDWTQEQLANRLGVSCQSVSRWECGDGYPDMEHLPTMARLFSVTMDDLIGYGEEDDKLPSHEMQKKFRNVLRNGKWEILYILHNSGGKSAQQRIFSGMVLQKCILQSTLSLFL